MQATGDAVVNLAADFQDPPEVIETFVKEWEKGSKIVLGIKSDQTNENIILRSIRNFYYRLVLKISDVEMHNNFSIDQEKDPFILEYMNWLCHHEFGLNQKYFNLDKSTLDGEKSTLNYWLKIWINFYHRISLFV